MSADSFPDPDHKVAMSADSFPDPDPDHEHDSLYYDRSAVPVCPDWVILEPFVFRRDDEESFPADLEAPVRASGKTSWEAPFKVAFSFAKPPRISRLYAQLPGFPGPDEQIPLAILGSHHNLALFRVATDDPKLCMLQDFFIYSANASSLVRLPPCTGPEPDYTGLRRSRRSRQGASTKRRLLTVKSVGLLCPDDGKQEFVVAELKLFKRSSIEVHADVRYLKSAADNGDKLGCTWKFDRVPIHCRDNSDIWQLYCWQTDAVVPMGNCLGWIDYYRGILLCDFCEDDPKVSFVRLPLDKFPDTNIRSIACSWLYRGVSYTRSGEVQFIDVARNDGIGYGALKPGSGFTITSHVLHIQSTMVWDKISTVTSDALWSDNPPERLPREVLLFPQVDINNPHLVHFLLGEFRYAFKKMWVVTIDFQTKTLKSSFRYINGCTGTVDADLTGYRSRCPMPFLSCEVSKYIRLKRKRLEVSSVILPD